MLLFVFLSVFTFGQSEQHIADSLLAVSEQNSGEVKIEALKDLAEFYLRRSPILTIKYSEEALKEMPDSQTIADLYSLIGLGNYYMGEYELALINYSKADSLIDLVADTKTNAKLSNNIGLVYSELGEKERALEYLLRALRLYQEANDSSGIAKSYNNLGLFYHNIKQFETALDYYKNAVKTKQIMRDTLSLPITYNNIGAVYEMMGKYEQAINYYTKSLFLREQFNETFGIASTLLNMGSVYKTTRKYSKAVNSFESGLILANKADARRLQLQAHKELASLYEITNQYKKAIDHQKAYIALKDSMFTKDLSKKIANLNIKYELSGKEREINLLKKQQAVHELEAENDVLFRNILILSLILIIVVAGFLIHKFHYRKRIVDEMEMRVEERTKELLEINQELREEIEQRKNIETELQNAREKAQEADQFKTRLLSNMSHEFRTPLNGILGFAELLETELADPEQLEMASGIVDAGRRLMRTLHLMLELSEFETYNKKRVFKSVALSKTLKPLIRQYYIEAERKTIQLQFVEPKTDLLVHGDKHLIEQIFHNLMDNAVKYTDEGSVSVVLTTVENNGVTLGALKIVDTGIGIDKNDVELIFHEFRQASEGFSRSFEGTGLGLSLSKKMAEYMNGDIEVDSTPDVGSTFTLILPIATESTLKQEKSTEQPVKEATPLPTEGETDKSKLPEILLVEDNYANKVIAQKFLQDICRVDYAKDGEKALQLAEEKEYAAFLMDINLGRGLNGLEITQILRKMEKYKETPIAAVTGYGMRGDKEKLLSEGCSHYLVKPFSKDELISLVRNMLLA